MLGHTQLYQGLKVAQIVQLANIQILVLQLELTEFLELTQIILELVVELVVLQESIH